MNLLETKICMFRTKWHEKSCMNFEKSFITEWEKKGGKRENITVIVTAGVLEIPLQAKLIAKTGKYHAIVATGLIADEKIYRHEFVANAVIENCMKVQMEYEIPLIHSIMTPQKVFSSADEFEFFEKHFTVKAKEACNALISTLENIENINDIL